MTVILKLLCWEDIISKTFPLSYTQRAVIF